MQREIHSGEHAALQADLPRGHFEANPLPGWRKRSHETTAHRSIGSQRNIIPSPIGPVLPIGVGPLYHHFTWKVGWIQIDVGEQAVVGVDDSRSSAIIEEMPMDARAGGRHMRELSGERRRVAADPFPR